jgi:hypothetical protein
MQRYDPPNPRLYRLQSLILAGLLAIMPLSAALLLLLGLLLSAPLLIFAALCVVLLMAPVLLGLLATPPLSISEQGITIHAPLLGERFLAWEQVEALKPYPLLPSRDEEVERRLAQGRMRYQVAEGLMLVSAALPWPYRVVGYFVGEWPRGAVACTNRAHADYAALAKRLRQRLPSTPLTPPPG